VVTILVCMLRKMASTIWSTSAAGITIMFCLLLSGCSYSRAFIDETSETTELANNSGSNHAGSKGSGKKTDSTAASASSVSLPGDAFPIDSAAPQFATSLSSEIHSTLDSASSSTAKADTPQTVWGLLDMRGFPVAQQVASNGVEYNPLFLLDLDFNIMLWREQGLYLFADSSFWGQKAAPGITNPSQGQFDFSKREFDFDLGAAWNYAGAWEARLFAYSFNNLNRGNSLTSPSGFNDGVGLENRYYLGETYAHLGTNAFDEARATFLSVGYYPTKSMVDGNGDQFKPGPFARAYLTWDLWDQQCYLYSDIQFIAARSFQPTLLKWDAGLAARPFTSVPRLEFRVGTQDMLDLRGGDLETGVYLAIRYVY
jgi:hypothetical protein